MFGSGCSTRRPAGAWSLDEHELARPRPTDVASPTYRLSQCIRFPCIIMLFAARVLPAGRGRAIYLADSELLFLRCGPRVFWLLASAPGFGAGVEAGSGSGSEEAENGGRCLTRMIRIASVRVKIIPGCSAERLAA